MEGEPCEVSSKSCVSRSQHGGPWDSATLTCEMSPRGEANRIPAKVVATGMRNGVRSRLKKREGPEMKDGSEEDSILETPTEGIRTFTLGYEGRTLSEVLRLVQALTIQQVLDVREVASSRKPGFASSELNEALAKIGVAYVHLPELGCEKEARHTLWRGGATADFRARYDQRIAERPGSVTDLITRVHSGRSLLLCLERDPAKCHRTLLSERLRAEGILVLDL